MKLFIYHEGYDTVMWSERLDPTTWSTDPEHDPKVTIIPRELYDEIVRRAAEAERNSIIAIIENRRDFHESFVNQSLDAGVTPSDSLYTAIAELNAILRELK